MRHDNAEREMISLYRPHEKVYPCIVSHGNSENACRLRVMNATEAAQRCRAGAGVLWHRGTGLARDQV